MLELILCSLPHRQLRNRGLRLRWCISGSLPHRQLRKVANQGFVVFERSLPHRQLRKPHEKHRDKTSREKNKKVQTKTTTTRTMHEAIDPYRLYIRQWFRREKQENLTY